MNDYTKPLDTEGWSAFYDEKALENVIKSISSGEVSIWTKELAKICEKGTKVLEIGCGTGNSSLWLAKNGVEVTAIDYSEKSVNLVKEAAKRLGITNIRVIQMDATKEMPFENKEFDFIFQAGLLEHFERGDQVKLLKMWKVYGKNMISMIPNASSVAYRVGKAISEKNGTWPYGREVPEHTFDDVFGEADITIDKEYSIGSNWALGFLPKRHYIRRYVAKLQKDGFDLDDMMQGYLLITIGKC